MSKEFPSRIGETNPRHAAARAAGAVLALTLAVTACQNGSGNHHAASPDKSPSTRPSASQTLPGHRHRNDPQLSLLKQYEKKAGVTPKMMEFIGFPQNNLDARIQAEQMAGTLRAWSAQHVRPLVIMEPTFNGGNTNMSLHKFRKGEYDGALATYFSTLRDLGVTDHEMGTWVPFPEPNLPQWANGVTNAKLFIDNTTRVAHAIKKEFPGAPVSVMLDSQTCDPGWANCATNDVHRLTEYLHFEPHLISSFGLQGFSWDNHDNPATYLSGQTAVACAQELGVNHVWFNTGTSSKVNNPNGEGIITAGNTRRAQLLGGVLTQAEAVQAAGLTVDFINVFGQNNFEPGNSGTGTAEWQYHSPGALGVLSTFDKAAARHHLPVAVFDSSGN